MKEKKVRKAVRTFIINNNRIIVIKYKTETNKNYYDIPGGKIEENESPKEASIREFQEETGMIILDQVYKGGDPLDFEENDSMWISIEKLLKEDKKFPCIEMIKYLERDNIQLKMYSDNHHNVLKIEG